MPNETPNPAPQGATTMAGNTPVAGKSEAPKQPGQRAAENAKPGIAQNAAVQPPVVGQGAPANQSMSQFTQSDEGKGPISGQGTQPGGMKRAEELPPESGHPSGVVQPGSPEDAARGFEPDRSPTAAPSSPKHGQ